MKVSFPVASIFGALLTIFQTVNLIWRYVVTGYPVIPFTLAADIISVLCMGVLSAGLFLRQRNVMITGPLLLESLGSLLSHKADLPGLFQGNPGLDHRTYRLCSDGIPELVLSADHSGKLL